MRAGQSPVRRFKARATDALTLRLLVALLLCALTSIVARAQESYASSTNQSAAAAAVAPPSYGSITGRVMSDDGRPLSNSMILLTPAGSSAATPSPPAFGTTDNSGRFEFKNLASGSYFIQPTVPGYVRLRDTDADEEAERTERPYYRIGDNVTLTLTRGGVITGTVTDASGKPSVATRVRVLRARDASAKPLRALTSVREAQTDDRGIYRVWGLEPGSYLVSAGSNSMYADFQASASDDAPTYYPSTTRDGATEVVVRYGEEQSGIDIRHRDERGHRISGILTGSTESGSSSGYYDGVNVSLIHTASGLVEDNNYMRGGEGVSFTFNGVADGEYDLMARRGFGANSAASPPLHIKVRGADISGLRLSLAPLGTIAGRVFMETPNAPLPTCEAKAEEQPQPPTARHRALEETILVARLVERPPERARSILPANLESQPRGDGEFLFGSLQPGRYRLEARLPDERWYVRSISLPGSKAPKPKPAAAATPGARASKSKEAAATTGVSNATDNAVTIGQGTQATGVRIALAGGAAKLSGRVPANVEGASLPTRLRLYLVPREAERADDPLRFGEASVRGDGTFTLTNLAPGRYWLLARTAPEPDPNDNATLPLAWNASARADLRRQAEAVRQEIELQPCQQLTNTTVRYPQSAPPVK